jgi:hypothetical protein
MDSLMSIDVTSITCRVIVVMTFAELSTMMLPGLGRAQ